MGKLLRALGGRSMWRINFLLCETNLGLDHEQAAKRMETPTRAARRNIHSSPTISEYPRQAVVSKQSGAQKPLGDIAVGNKFCSKDYQARETSE